MRSWIENPLSVLAVDPEGGMAVELALIHQCQASGEQRLPQENKDIGEPHHEHGKAVKTLLEVAS